MTVQIFTPSPRPFWLLHAVARTRIWHSGGSRPAYQSLKLSAYTPAFQPRVILALVASCVASESLLLSLFPSSLSVLFQDLFERYAGHIQVHIPPQTLRCSIRTLLAYGAPGEVRQQIEFPACRGFVYISAGQEVVFSESRQQLTDDREFGIPQACINHVSVHIYLCDDNTRAAD